MKNARLIKLLVILIPTVLVLLTALIVTLCMLDRPDDPGEVTLPETIETVDTGADEPGPEPGPTVVGVKYPASSLPDLEKYATASHIKEVLGSRKTYAFTLHGTKYYDNGELKDGGSGIVAVRNEDGTLAINVAKLGARTGNRGLTVSEATPEGTATPEVVAAALNMGVVVYDHKLVLFFEGEQPLHTYEDLYTYEAMHLYMTDAAQSDIINAFIELPDRISNDSNNTIYYTSPDLNLGVQTSIYYAQMGQSNGLPMAPALVVGEGKHADNFTTVRVFNNQNTCTTQFLAFDASVKGGVQVAAAQVGEEVLIATAPFAAHDGADGDIRVFDTYGMIRMVINVRSEISGPHTVVTGQFVEGVEDEMLLVASQTTNDKGELTYAIISLSDGVLISKHTLDCSFALTGEKADVPVALSVRRNVEGMDTIILYFNSIQAVYEGDAQKAKFDKAEITLPDDATGVSPSTVGGQKYLISLPAREGSEDQSFLTVYDENAKEGNTLDVGFQENRFFIGFRSDTYATTDKLVFNDDKYICKAPFYHIRTDFSSNASAGIGRQKSDLEIDDWFDKMVYADWAYTGVERYSQMLNDQYLMLEPCFTHRWTETFATRKLVNYVDPYDGVQKYVSWDRNDSTDTKADGYTGTYADGLLELAKLRIYPLRSFLQSTATAFRGDGANPEHLVAVSPVHEQELAVPNATGDYNPYFVEGFRHYLIERFGTVENINLVFGTNFADFESIDPPRDTGRGEWDNYKGDYYDEWVLYGRYIVSKRIMEAYREALLAGYPPEAITAHSIPEGEATTGLVGNPINRITPVDVILSCGTAYGGTRYGSWSPRNNIAYNAQLAGHNNMTIGEYSAMSQTGEQAFEQLMLVWNSGVRMIHHMDRNEENKIAGVYAVEKLIEDNNLPRPGYTGGTTNAVSVHMGVKQYNIVQIGAGADTDSIGLLKSIGTDGKWEGSVYLVPFHAKVTSNTLDALNAPVEGTQNTFATGVLGTIKNSDQVEITFQAAKVGEARAWVTFEVYQNGCLMEKSVTTYDLTETMTPYRYVLSNQLYDNDLEIKVSFHTEAGDGSMESIKLENLCGTFQQEKYGTRFFDGAKVNRISQAHEGGVTFDLLDRGFENNTFVPEMPESPITPIPPDTSDTPNDPYVPDPDVERYNDLVVDFSKIAGATQRGEADGYAWQLKMADPNVIYLDLGSIDLSKYVAVNILYGGDIELNHQYAENDALFYLTSTKESVGSYDAGVTEGDHIIVTAPIEEINPVGWYGSKQYQIIDLADVTYNGQVYLTIPTRKPDQPVAFMLFGLEFVGAPLGEGVDPDDPPADPIGPDPDVECYDNLVVDFSKIEGATQRGEADDYAWQLKMADALTYYLDLGTMNLNKYSAVRILYGGDIELNHQYASNNAQFYLTSTRDSVGSYNAGVTEGDHIVATAPIEEINPVGWYGSKQYQTIDLADITYNGQVYLTIPSRDPAQPVAFLLFGIEFIGGPLMEGIDPDDPTPDPEPEVPENPVSYTITYQGKDGSTISSCTVDSGQTVPAPTAHWVGNVNQTNTCWKDDEGNLYYWNNHSKYDDKNVVTGWVNAAGDAVDLKVTGNMTLTAWSLVVDFSTISGAGYRGDGTPQLGNIQSTAFDLGAWDLSRFSAVKVTYGFDPSGNARIENKLISLQDSEGTILVSTAIKPVYGMRAEGPATVTLDLTAIEQNDANLYIASDNTDGTGCYRIEFIYEVPSTN